MTMASTNFLNLKGKIAIITGASAGIGEATAIEFARQGCHLTLCGRDETRLKSVIEKCHAAGENQVKVECVTGDLLSREVQNNIVKKTIDVFGKIDILVNNAGACNMGNPLNTDFEKYDFLMRTNVDSVFFLTQLVIPHLIKTEGNIVNLSSFVSTEASPAYVAYAMTKAAIDSYTKSLSILFILNRVCSEGIDVIMGGRLARAAVLAPQKVRVNAVNPGSIVTMIYRRGDEAMDDKKYEEFVTKSAKLHPLGNRVGLTSEVANAIVFLASDRASFTTGQTLYVDGGRNNAGAMLTD